MDINLQSELLNSVTVVSGYRQLIQLEMGKEEPNQILIDAWLDNIARAEQRMTGIIRSMPVGVLATT